MNAEPENFEALRKLMVLKRYEQPPPGYFDKLRCRILLRLEENEPTFFERISDYFVFRPAMACALGLAFCSSVASGLIFAFQMRPVQVANERGPAQSWNMASAEALPDQSASAFSLHVPGYDRFAASNDSVRASLFQPFNSQTLPVSYGPAR